MRTSIEWAGFVDLQVNGFAGVDFSEPGTPSDEIVRALEAMRATGVTRCLPTLITSSLDRFVKCARQLAGLDHPGVAGLHMEGPYISAVDGARGAHPLAHVATPSLEDFDRRQEAASGLIRLVTLAPEIPGALALTEHLVARGVRVAIGHSVADPEAIRDAVRAGATLSTHLGNGCPLELPRHPNLLWEQLAADGLAASLIADGHHLPEATVKAMVRAKTPERTILVTDAVAPAGALPGRYAVAGLPIALDDRGRVTKVDDPSMLAGSALTLERAVANAVRFTHLPLPSVLRMASEQPAAYLGIVPAGRITATWDPCTFEFKVIDVRL